jgi:hypothetical protein
MPAQPLPAEGTGQGRVVYQDQGHQLRAVLYRRAATGAWVQVTEMFVSYPMTQRMLAKLEGIPGPEELGWSGSVDELGALGARIKKAAKKVAKSKALKTLAKVAKVAAPIAAIVPGGQAIAAAGLVGKVASAAKKAKSAKKAISAAKGAAAPSPAPARANLSKVAPKLSASLKKLQDQGGRAETPTEARALEAAKVLAATPPEQRGEVAEKIETRMDSFKVTSPNGDVVWVPMSEVAQ